MRSNNSSLSEATRKQLMASAHELTQAGLQRRRVTASCIACRTTKQKCSGDLICTRCAHKSMECIYTSPLPPSNSSEPHTMSPSSTPAIVAITPGIVRETNLSDKILVHELVESYFTEVSPLRSFGFIHKPSFMRKLDEGHGIDGKIDPLIYAMCAVATKASGRHDLWNVGIDLANTAQRMVLQNLDDISTHSLMCVVLLHEHAIRTGQLNWCFLFSSIAARISQALQLNLEYDYDVLCTGSRMSTTEKETRRRLLWAVFIIDSGISSGVDQLELIHEKDIKIQLPCDEEKFLFRRPCITETISPGCILDFIPEELRPLNAAENMGYRAYIIRIFVLRNRVLQYLKRYSNHGSPWSPTSDFALIINDLKSWKASLPADLEFIGDVIYIRKEQSLLSTLVHLHISYYQCFCDLYRIVIPAMMFPPEPQSYITMNAPPGFLEECQKTWLECACTITEIFRQTLPYAPQGMAEHAIGMSAYEVTRIQILYITKLIPNEMREAQKAAMLPLIEINLSFLRALQTIHPGVRLYLIWTEKLVRRAGLPITTTLVGESTEAEQSALDIGTGASPATADYHLHPLSLFRQLRERIPEKHAPGGENPLTMLFNATEQSQLQPQRPPPLFLAPSGMYEAFLPWTSFQVREPWANLDETTKDNMGEDFPFFSPLTYS